MGFLKSVVICTTDVISIICFNFNKIISWIINFICFNFHDQFVNTIGPYTMNLPITIHYADYTSSTYFEVITNKFKLLSGWKWDSDIQGLYDYDINSITNDYNDDFEITILYSIKSKKEVYMCNIKLKSLSIKHIKKYISTKSEQPESIITEKNILFGEINLL